MEGFLDLGSLLPKPYTAPIVGATLLDAGGLCNNGPDTGGGACIKDGGTTAGGSCECGNSTKVP